MCNHTPHIIYSEGKYFEENRFEVLENGFISYHFTRDEVDQNSVATARKNNLSSLLGQKKLIYSEDMDYVGQVSSLYRSWL